jgi:hypothetical protein
VTAELTRTRCRSSRICPANDREASGNERSPVIFTVGHGTRPIVDFRCHSEWSGHESAMGASMTRSSSLPK